tara:strand:- start:121303 stop:122526 length:1224 start_codon:yes stop_codon:yes gene_type:complete
MHSDDIVISVRDVTKSYRIFGNAGTRLKQAMTFGLKKYYEEYTALKDVSFEVKRGETIGIIGSNGAGKSTLLQLICGILKPSSGTVEVNGRVSAMLELGAGFNTEFTGRENAYFQGSLVGLTKAQMKSRFDEIEAFADIGEFIDQPVRTYSSGMFMRLAFAVNVHVDPDVLIIDEILAVGDTSFQQKCFDLIYKIQAKGTTILWVSHNPYQIERLCDKAAVLNKGYMSDLQPAKDILSLYHDMTQSDLTLPVNNKENVRVGTQALYFDNVKVISNSDDNVIRSNESLKIVADVVATFPMKDIRFRFEVCSSNNDIVTVLASIDQSEKERFSGKHRISFTMGNCRLTSGWYYVNAVVSNRNVRLDTWQRVVDFKVLLRNKKAQNLSLDQGVMVSDGKWEFCQQQNESA